MTSPYTCIRPSNKRLALAGGTIYATPAGGPIRNGTILIEDSKIVAVGARDAVRSSAAYETLDCCECTVTAGFWNSHVHFFERKWANAPAIPADELQRQLYETFTRFGFTTVFDAGSPWQNTRAIRDRIESGEVTGPRIFSTGEALVPRGALPSAQVLAALGYVHFPAPEISDAAQAAAAASHLLAAGVDGIKIFPSSPRGASIPDDAIAAAASAARRAAKPAFAHPDTRDDIVAAIRGGVNVVAHTTPRSGLWDDALVAEMQQRAVALTPTLALWTTLFRHDRISVAEQLVDAAVEQLRAWHAAGGAVLFGTDLGAVDADPGDEYALMARAGLNFRAILASLTSAPAEHFGVRERLGRIEPGCDADLTVLAGDPAAGLRALTGVRYVVRGGCYTAVTGGTLKRVG